MYKFSKSFLLTLLLLYTVNISVLADNYQSGLNALKQNNLSSALQYFSQSIQENRNDPYRLYYLGVTLNKMGEKARAQKAFETALKLNPPAALVNQINSDINSSSSPRFSLSNQPLTKLRSLNNSNKTANYLEYVAPNNEVVRWDLSKMPLKVYIARGSNLKGYNPEYKTVVLNALKTWQLAMKNKIRFISVSSADNADIKIDWVEKFEGHRIGENPFVSLKDVILRSDVTISTIMPDGVPKTPGELYRVTLHEMGHVLGFQGHSPYKEDAMYYALNKENYNSVLTQRDVDTMRMLYQLDASVSNKLPLDMAATKEFYRLQLQAEKQFVQKDFKGALNNYLLALRIYDKDFAVQLNTGICFAILNDFSSAISHYEKADYLNPGDTMVRYNLALAQINYANNLSPNQVTTIKAYFKKALDNLTSIANKPDKPSQTDDLISKIQEIL